MATLHLMVGLPCSGKTTLAKRIEHEANALRLTPDEWITDMLGDDPPRNVLDASRDPVETALWALAQAALELGIDVVLDFGFWSRTERDAFRAGAQHIGAHTETHFLDASLDELLTRLDARNRHRPAGTFVIDEASMRHWHARFEPPTADELAAQP